MALTDFLNGAHYRRENEQQQAEILQLREANLQLLGKNEELERLQVASQQLATKHELLVQQYGRLQELAKKLGVLDLLQVQRVVEGERAHLVQIRSECDFKKGELELIESQLKDLRAQILVAEEEILLESFALYRPKFAMTNSAEYRAKLDQVRARQKAMIKAGTAATGGDGWHVNNSIVEGRKLAGDMRKLVIRSFNNEADYCVDNVKFNNVELGEKRINQSFEALNRLGRVMSVRLTQEYLQLKLDELHLAYEFQVKKQEEKDAQRKAREELREQYKLEQEIREAREKIAKERKHFKAALGNLDLRLATSEDEVERANLRARIAEIQASCDALDGEERLIDYREKNAKAGYVYVISNIGAFGEDVFKIGMTRRLDPLERVDELGDASVPFYFDIHALVFSDDAPALEAKIQQRFHSTRLNKVNGRKEFFRAKIEDIEDVIRASFDAAVEVVREAPAEQYRESLRLM
jgi:hypothetical protein